MILQVKNLTVGYYRNKQIIPAIKNINLNLNFSEIISIVGESGSGKTTLAYSIMNLIMPYEGKILQGEIFFYKDNKQINLLSIDNQNMRKIRGKNISIVFQDPFSSLNPILTVGEQITETVIAHNNIPKNTVKEYVFEILSKVQIKDVERIYNSYPHQLSGGQRQRVCIAIAIINKPDILIADEPTTALDTTIQKEILNLLWDLQNSFNMSIILITHNLYLTLNTHKIYVMYNGEIIESGYIKDILKNPQKEYTLKLLNSAKRWII